MKVIFNTNISKVFAIASIASALSCPAVAQDFNSQIAKHLNSKGVAISMPKELDNRLKSENGNAENAEARAKSASVSSVGYRIQVITDNNYQNARRNVEARQNSISAAFPNLRCYTTYKAPAWRLRVGDFHTRQEAKDMLDQIKQAFPRYAREMTIVQDRINIEATE